MALESKLQQFVHASPPYGAAVSLCCGLTLVTCQAEVSFIVWHRTVSSPGKQRVLSVGQYSHKCILWSRLRAFPRFQSVIEAEAECKDLPPDTNKILVSACASASSIKVLFRLPAMLLFRSLLAKSCTGNIRSITPFVSAVATVIINFRLVDRVLTDM